MSKYCIMCGSKMEDSDNFCTNCGSNQKPSINNSVAYQTSVQNNKQLDKSKIEAGILGIFLGGLGIHNFYLGNNTRGIIQIIITICTCGYGALWGITEGVLILLGFIKEDSEGLPLK